jgi:tetratricopeptide (TPR) repeat protein
VTHHPSATELEGLLLGGLAKEKIKAAVAHLLQGCAACQMTLKTAAEKQRVDRRVQGAVLTAAVDEAYDNAIDRALATAQQEMRAKEALALLVEEGPAALAQAPRRLQGLPSFEAFLRRSWDLRHDNPAQAVQLARQALSTVEALSQEGLAAEQVADLRCQAYAALGNASRVADDLTAAEEQLREALSWYAEGTRDEMLLARLADFQASLYTDQRRLDLASKVLDTAYAIYHARGEDHLAGRALISKGIYTGYANDPEGALRLLNEGLARIDTRNDPDLTLRAIHSMAWFMVDLGRFRDAQMLVRQNFWRYERSNHQVDLLRLRWLEGRAAAGLGELELAERALLEVKRGFEALGHRYNAALASLDLAVVYLRQGRAADTQGTVLQASATFLDLRIGREALSAVLVLQSAFKQELMAQALLEKAVQFLRRVEHDPTLSFKAWFL